MQTDSISVVIPVYNSQQTLKPLVLKLKEVLEKTAREFEIIMVNDASEDNSWSVIKDLSRSHQFIRGLDMMRNYGQHNLQIKVARILNTFGPRTHPNDGWVVSNFIIQSLRNEPITIYGKGDQTRVFCYVDEQIIAWIRFMDTPDDFTGPVNLGNPEETSIVGLAKMITELCGSGSELVYKPLPEDDPVQQCPDITLAKSKLDWEPKTSLEAGLKKTINYFKEIA